MKRTPGLMLAAVSLRYREARSSTASKRRTCRPGFAWETFRLVLPMSPVLESLPLQRDEVASIQVQGRRYQTSAWDRELYRSRSGKSDAQLSEKILLRAVPYHTWANRTGYEMRVWMQREERS